MLGSSVISASGQDARLALPSLPTTPQAKNSNKIQFHGQVPATTINARLDPLDLCPNAVTSTGVGGPGSLTQLAGQAYQFEFESNCVGEAQGWPTPRVNPPFRWTIKYLTETGTVYQQYLEDKTLGDYSKIRLYMYDRVPDVGVPTNVSATNAGGNLNVRDPGTAPASTAAVGDYIVGVRLECTGYTCGTSGLNDNDAISINYYSRRTGAIGLAGTAPVTLCRSQPYALNWTAPYGATGYLVSATGGALVNGAASVTLVGAGNTTATLTLNGLPAGAAGTLVTVQAVNAANACGTTLSEARTRILNVQTGTTLAQNMTLTNGLCPTLGTSNSKTVAVDGGIVSGLYKWAVSGSPVTVLGGVGNVNAPTLTFQDVPVGSVTFSVQKQISSCEGFGPPVSQTYNFNTLPITCPRASEVLLPALWCAGSGNAVSIRNAVPGLRYTYNITNVTPTGIRGGGFVTVNPPASGAAAVIITPSANTTSFILSVSVETPCAPSGFNTTAVCQTFVISSAMISPICSAPTGPRLVVPSVLYPNPATGVVNIAATEGATYQWLRLVNSQGTLLLERKGGAESVQSFDVSEYPRGLYQVQLFDGKKLTTERLVKE